MVTSQKKSGRSPAYPDFDLREAIEKARILWDKEGRNFAPLSTIQEHWGYKENTGTGLRAVAALKQFGLLSDRGRGDNRQACLTELALSIVLDQRETSTERIAAIQEAALAPSMHSQLWEEYKGDLPSDATLQFVLQKERKFSPRGAKSFIKELRGTIAFSKLEYVADVAAHNDEELDDNNSDDNNATFDPSIASQNLPKEHLVAEESPVAETRVLQLPLLGGTWAAVQIPQFMSESDWKQMMAVLEAMRPGIVKIEQGDA